MSKCCNAKLGAYYLYLIKFLLRFLICFPDCKLYFVMFVFYTSSKIDNLYNFTLDWKTKYKDGMHSKLDY